MSIFATVSLYSVGKVRNMGLEGLHPETLQEIIADLEAVARGWNQEPTPFVWGGKRALRHQRSRQRRHALGGSGACTLRPIRARKTIVQK